MLDLAGLEALPSTGPLLVTLVVRPDEIELALATNGASLQQRLLLALVAELTLIETADASEPLLLTKARRHAAFTGNPLRHERMISAHPSATEPQE